MPLLFIDTESDIKTKEIISIQYGYGDTFDIINSPINADARRRIADMWKHADAVIMYNAPYDLGVLSTLEQNKFSYHNNSWILDLFGFRYRVKRINGFRNLIKGYGRNTPPVIDLLKLWSIFIDDNDISLKSLIKKVLHETPIPYTPENSRRRDYQLQDVIQLQKIWRVFLEKVKMIPPVSAYSLSDFAAVSTPATCSKRAYKIQYPSISKWKLSNEIEDKKYGLTYALERAYNGGITMALHRGTVHNTAWYDIHGAYAHVNEYLNVDRYKKYHWSIIPETLDDGQPELYYVSSDAVITSINHSLKLFRVRTPTKCYMWNYDRTALQNIFPDARIDILKIFKPMPDNDVPRSLSAIWSDLKEREEKEHGKTTLREYYKFMSNTAYGITAQRKPYSTAHTNMCIAGMTTARTHLILSIMIRTARQHGYKWLYSDTDSICIAGDGDMPYSDLENEINKNIAPYSVGCEFIGDTKILSLKRYHAFNGVDLSGDHIPDKIRLHGKSVYKITNADMLELMTTGDSDKKLIISQISANTAITYKRVLKLNKHITNPHPFMFETGIDTGEMLTDWYDEWIKHIDRKATAPDNAKIGDSFTRNFITFQNMTAARLFYGIDEDDYTIDDYTGLAYRLYDCEDKLLFNDRNNTTTGRQRNKTPQKRTKND